ncbi:MAG: twin-arginine translocation signal domain-containing protein [Raoultibacter sp.]
MKQHISEDLSQQSLSRRGFLGLSATGIVAVLGVFVDKTLLPMLMLMKRAVFHGK